MLRRLVINTIHGVFWAAVIGAAEPIRVSGETVLTRAHARVEELLASYERPALGSEAEEGMLAVVEGHARAAGLVGWPGIAPAIPAR
jgi:hypothetical protein